jgi:hypothetical protein
MEHMDDESPQMIDASTELAEPVLVPPRGLWAVALALFALTAVAGILWAPPVKPHSRPDLTLETWREVDLATMRHADDALLRDKPATPEQVKLEQQIQTQFKLYLQREAALLGQTADDAAARMALGEVEESVRTLVQRYGPAPLKRLSVQFGRDVHSAAEAAILAARAKHQPFALSLQAQPLPADVSALTALAGALGTSLAHTGIERQVRDGKLDPAAGQVIETIAQARFLQLGARIPGGPPQLASSAWFLVQHFRVEAHIGLDLRRRLALLDDLATTDPAYPGDYARGVLLAREEQYDEAATWFDRAAKHGAMAHQARDNARWCRERAAQVGSPPKTSR